MFEDCERFPNLWASLAHADVDKVLEFKITDREISSTYG